MANPNRGEVWLVDLGMVAKTRPCLVALLLLLAPPSPGSEPDGKRPFFDARQHRTEYAGPRSQPAEAVTVNEVRIGYFGPSDPDDPVGGDMWRAAQLAVERANADGGHRGKPFRLVPAWSENPWGTGTAQLARLVYRHHVWAVVGGIDGPSTHLAEQVVAKAGLTLVSPVSTDKTVNLAGVPWMFSLAPGDHLAAEPLAEEIKRRKGTGDLVLLSADDHDSRMFTAELKKALSKRNLGLRRQIEFHRGARQSATLARQVLEIGPAIVIVSADPGDSARQVAALRTAGYVGRIFGGPAMGHREFVARAADAAEGVVFPLLYTAPGSPLKKGATAGLSSSAKLELPQRVPLLACPAVQREHSPRNTAGQASSGTQIVSNRFLQPTASDSAPGSEFHKAYNRKHERQPDYTAAHTYDAVRLLVAAIRTAGPDRAGIRDALVELSPWTGATGLVRFDGLGSNTRSVPLGTIGNGLARPISSPSDLPLSKSKPTGGDRWDRAP